MSILILGFLKLFMDTGLSNKYLFLFYFNIFQKYCKLILK